MPYQNCLEELQYLTPHVFLSPRLLTCFQILLHKRTRVCFIRLTDGVSHQISSLDPMLTSIPKEPGSMQQVDLLKYLPEAQTCVALVHFRDARRSREIRSLLQWLPSASKRSLTPSKLELDFSSRHDIIFCLRHFSFAWFCFNSSILVLIRLS